MYQPGALVCRKCHLMSQQPTLNACILRTKSTHYLPQSTCQMNQCMTVCFQNKCYCVFTKIAEDRRNIIVGPQTLFAICFCDFCNPHGDPLCSSGRYELSVESTTRISSWAHEVRWWKWFLSSVRDDPTKKTGLYRNYLGGLGVPLVRLLLLLLKVVRQKLVRKPD